MKDEYHWLMIATIFCAMGLAVAGQISRDAAVICMCVLVGAIAIVRTQGEK